MIFLDRQAPKISALRVDSVPAAQVYINGQLIGATPFVNEKMTPGEYRLKLVATGATGIFFPWETRIKLVNDSLTYVSRDIGKSEENSGHHILWLEKLPSIESGQIAVVSEPNGAKVSVDGIEKGFTSLIIKNIPQGDRKIIISSEGYSDQIINGKIRGGFRLNASVKLARKEISPASPSASPTATASAQIATSSGLQKPYVLIKQTGTGFLRVRFGPTITASESTRVNPGDKFPLVAEENGWTKVKIASISGWVNDQYIQKFK